MKRSSVKWTVPVLLAALAGSCAEAVPDGDGDNAETDSDSATLRQKAMTEWFNEGDAKQGPSATWSPEYRRFIMKAAGVERSRWGGQLPSPDARFVPTLVTGTTWTNLGPTQAHFLSNGTTTLNVTDSGRARSIIVDGARIFIATAGGGVWRSADGGGVWTPVTEGLGSLSVGSLAMDPGNHNVLYLGLGDPFDGTGIGLVKSTDAGNTWSDPSFLGDSTIIPQVLVHPTLSNIVMVATNKGLYRSTDSGATWALVPIDPGDRDTTGNPILPYVWSIASTGGHGFVLGLEGNHALTTATTDGQIWTSADDGATWTRATGFTKTAGVGRVTVASAPSSPQTVYAMAAVPNATTSSDLADMFKSTNGGATWTALNVTAKQYTNKNTESSTVGTLLNGQGWYDQLILVSPTSPTTVFFGGALLLAKTTDGGSSFSEVTNWLAQFSLPYVHADFHAGTFDASGNLYVGTDGGVFLSSDGGAHFTDALNVGIVTHLLYSVGSSPAARDVVLGGMQDNGTRIREGTTSVFNETLGGDGFGSDVNRSNPQQMLGTLYYDRIYKSTNGGSSFTLASTGITESNNSTTAPFITRILAWEGSTTGNDVYTYSNTKVYKSANYAGSWSAVGAALPVPTGGIVRNIGVAASSASVVGAVGSGGYVYLSTNGGSTWTILAHGKTSTDPATALPNSNLSLSCIYFDRTNPAIVYVASVAPDATASHLWKSTNSGASFTALDGNGLPAGVPINVIKSDPQSATVLFAGTHFGVYRSADGGATWSRFGNNMPLVNVMDIYISPDTSLVRAATFGRGFWELGGTTQTNDFSVNVSPTTVNANQGGSGTATVTTAVTAGAAQSVALSATGLPAGATATFAPPSLTGAGTSTLTLTAAASTPAGTYSVTVTGTAASGTHTRSVSFVVAAPSDFSLTVGSSSVGAVQGTSVQTTVTTAVTSGAAQSVALSVTGLPSGASFGFVPTSLTGAGTSTLTLTAGATTPVGTYALTVVGTGTSATHTQPLTLVVTAPAVNDFSLGLNPTSVTAVQGGAAGPVTVTTAIVSGGAQTITLSATGLPAGASASFTPSSQVSAGSSATLTLSAGAGTAPGAYTVHVTGTTASASHSQDVGFTVTPQPSDFALAASPGSVSVAQGQAGTSGISASITSGQAQAVSLDATGMPAGATVSFVPTSVTSGGSSATMTLSAGSTTPPGTYAITVTGTAPSGTHTTSVSLTVTSTGGGSPIANGDFETGTLAGWTSAGSTSVAAGRNGGSAGMAGLGNKAPTNGDSSLAQTFTVPAAGGTLSFWTFIYCPDTVVYDWVTATLKDNTTGTTTTVLSKTCTTTNAWQQVTAPVQAGHSVTLTLISHDDNYAGDGTYALFDDVTISAPVGNPVQNPGFEAGGLASWTSTGTTSASTAKAHTGTTSARLGSTQPTNGDSTIAQTFTVPTGASTLSFYYFMVCPDTVTYDWASATLKDNTTGTTTTVLAKVCTNSTAWTQKTAQVTAGHSYTLTLDSRDDNYTGDATYTYFDDIVVQ